MVANSIQLGRRLARLELLLALLATIKSAFYDGVALKIEADGANAYKITDSNNADTGTKNYVYTSKDGKIVAQDHAEIK